MSGAGREPLLTCGCAIHTSDIDSDRSIQRISHYSQPHTRCGSLIYIIGWAGEPHLNGWDEEREGERGGGEGRGRERPHKSTAKCNRSLTFPSNTSVEHTHT